MEFLLNNLDIVKQHCRKLINIAGKCGLTSIIKKQNVIIGRRSREFQQGAVIEVEYQV